MLFLHKDREEADYVEWLKGQAELEVEEDVKDMVSVLVWILKGYWT